MKLATLRTGGRDGTLVVVRRDGAVCARAPDIAPTLQAALDDWERALPALERLAEALEAGRAPGAAAVDPTALASPLPRAYEWIDGSAYLSHVVLVRRARGAEPPPTLATDPLVYQGGSGAFLAPTEPIPLGDPAWGLDLEAEVAVVLADTPAGTTSEQASRFVRLVMLANDVTFRNLVPSELAKGFGFFGSKPATAFSPFAVTPDELGPAWRGGRLHLPVRTRWNGDVIGRIDAGAEMHFSFFDLVAHVARTRAFCAGTILGGGTVSSADPAAGVSCLAERRAREIVDTGGAARTRYLEAGDTVEIDVADSSEGGGPGPFGAIRQTVIPGGGPN